MASSARSYQLAMTSDNISKSLSNAAVDALKVWIEPWCDELILPSRSTVAVSVIAPVGIDIALPDFEIAGATLVIWAACPGTLAVSIDGIVQDTGSKEISLPPALFDMPIKDFVGTVFGNQPQARPGGAAAPAKRSIWQRLLRGWRSIVNTL